MTLFSDFHVIHSYTRAQALDDGVLVDVTEWASPREMMRGFTIPVAMTAAVWALCEAPEESGESARGRAHDVLWMASLAARRHGNNDRANFLVEIGGETVALWLQIGPGDSGEPVATIMLQGED
jgi:D-tyrosyl-tRNA(Tyr) deacylase